MRTGFLRRLGLATTTVALTWVVGSLPAAQEPAPTPRLPDGTVNLGRVPGEKGVWNVPYITNMGVRVLNPDGTFAVPQPARGRAGRGSPPAGRGSITLGSNQQLGFAGGTESSRGGAKTEPQVPFQPWAAAVYDYNSKNFSKYDPEGYCIPPGGPRLMATPYPMEIIQLPEQKRIVMIFEGATHVWREIYMDGRPHPKNLEPSYYGHSIGHWETDALVVDTVGFNEKFWIDREGEPHTDKLHVVERFSRPDFNTLQYELTVDDPGAYTATWTGGFLLRWSPNTELFEYICQDNNQSPVGMVGTATSVDRSSPIVP